MLTFYENTINQLHIVLLTQLTSNISYSNSVTSTLVIYNPYFNTTQKILRCLIHPVKGSVGNPLTNREDMEVQSKWRSCAQVLFYSSTQQVTRASTTNGIHHSHPYTTVYEKRNKKCKIKHSEKQK